MIVSERKQSIRQSLEIVPIIHALLNAQDKISRDREHFYAIGLNTKNVIQYVELVSLGSLSAAIVHPRETFRFAVLKGVASVIFAHNHPSGDTSPSREDIVLTKRLSEAGQILGITVLDHVIVAASTEVKHYSFRDNGLITQ